MFVRNFTFAAIGLFMLVTKPPSRDERGLSQSAETAILVAGAVAVAMIVVGLITVYVRTKINAIP